MQVTIMRNEGLDNLLALDGVRMNYQGEFWVKFDVALVEITMERPHGIKYSLSLHDGTNKRIMGFDNAHAVKVSKGFKGRKYAYDHVHKSVSDPGTEYSFNTPEQLITDFWCEIDKVLAQLEK
jgi:hypothetical protein